MRSAYGGDNHLGSDLFFALSRPLQGTLKRKGSGAAVEDIAAAAVDVYLPFASGHPQYGAAARALEKAEVFALVEALLAHIPLAAAPLQKSQIGIVCGMF